MYVILKDEHPILQGPELDVVFSKFCALARHPQNCDRFLRLIDDEDGEEILNSDSPIPWTRPGKDL